MIAFLALTSFFQGWLSFKYWAVWVGGILGVVLPDIDNLVSSQILGSKESLLFNKGLTLREKFKRSISLMYTPRQESTNLIFHSALFQVVFVIFAFLLVTSSGSLLGIGLVLAFMLHLTIDQVSDLIELGQIDRWFIDFPLELDAKNKVWYVIVNIVLVLVFGLLL